MKYIRVLRVHYWTKNILLLIPLLASHQYTNISKIIEAIHAIFIFSLLASVVYIFNDYIDQENDKLHPTKKFRPICSHSIGNQQALLLVIILVICISFNIFYLANYHFAIVLLAYFIATSIYTLWAKKIKFLDVIFLSSFYAIRIVAGAIATDVELSSWLITFSAFMFISLAMSKKYSELITYQKNNISPAKAYQLQDMKILLRLGIIAGILSLATLIMYINADKSIQMYSNPKMLYFILPLMAYWQTRIWKLTYHGKIHDDNLLFALKDLVSIGCSILILLFLVLAK